MLNAEAEFPQNGSYALLVDTDLPVGQQAAELVRIMYRPIGQADTVAVSFPLRTNASGNKVVAFADLIDARPLNRDETRALTDLDRKLRGRKPRSAAAKADAATLAALQSRALWFPHFAKKMDALHAQQRQRAA